jgi:hypothetical protein
MTEVTIDREQQRDDGDPMLSMEPGRQLAPRLVAAWVAAGFSDHRAATRLSEPLGGGWR